MHIIPGILNHCHDTALIWNLDKRISSHLLGLVIISLL